MQFPAIIYQDEDGMFVGEIPTLKGCGSSAKTLDRLYDNLEDAIKLCLEVQQKQAQDYKYSFHVISLDAVTQNHNIKEIA